MSALSFKIGWTLALALSAAAATSAQAQAPAHSEAAAPASGSAAASQRFSEDEASEEPEEGSEGSASNAASDAASESVEGAPRAEDSPAPSEPVMWEVDWEALRSLSSEEGGGQRQPWDLSDDELRAQGWSFTDQTFRRGSPLAGLAALTVGLPIHGVGHLIVQDTDSMFKLLMTEIAALGLAGVGTLMRDAAPQRSGVWSAGQTLQVAGLSVLAGGWIADIVGSFKGTTIPLPRNSLDLTGLAVDVHYTALFSDEVGVNSVAVLGLQWSGARFVFRPRFSMGPADGYWRGDLAAEFRIPFLSGGYSYVSLWSELGEELFQDQGWGRDLILGGVGVSLDIGELLEHTHGLVWQLRVGAGAQAFFYEAQGDRRFVRRNVRMFAPVDTLIAMNLNRGLNVAIGYRHRPDELVGTLTRQGGVFYQRFTVLPINRLGISLQLEQGEWLRLWIGVRYYLTNPTL